ncbi:SDR family NAD(P)-dependent oxidoreductase [Pseudomonas typographi]|uniref:SDR family NAD(P)-dependent oxidoreductase n=1 Tax=Pseudomonas typographi TaxID=2715964 RepID=UPI001684675D|nr:SDR family oxidoreductase [Pseudomonas typographi]MBD1551839.1 SDR family oxidoreductase [Pseudomonas typographi]MBD1587644.1 SDR family oxidoreductase [Pseudomonas typographi]
MTQRFENKVVLVTGAAAGIGAAIAHYLLESGATVVAADLRLENFGQMLAEVPEPLRARLHTYAMDVSDERAVSEVMGQIAETQPSLDAVVNNAGGSLMGGVAEITFEAWSHCLAVDLNSVFIVSKAALPLLQRSRGSIVNVASISGLFADHRMAAYNAAKGGVINLTRSLAVDYGPAGVRANVVAPGPVRTPALEKLLARDGSLLNAWQAGTPLGRIAEPADVAAAVAFLISDEARQISGVVLPVDGGFTAKTGQPDLAAVLL